MKSFSHSRLCSMIAAIICCYVALNTSHSVAQVKTPDAKQTEFSPGLAVGDPIPKIELNNQSGKPVLLGDMLKQGPVALVLFRSASW